MHAPSTILPLCKDAGDEIFLSTLLAGIPGVSGVVAGDQLPLLLDSLRGRGAEPRLAIVSGRLYPEARPELAVMLRSHFPAIEFLVVTAASDPFPDMQRLACDRVRHLAINPISREESMGEAKELFRLAVTKLVAGGHWEMTEQVRPGTPIHTFAVSSSAEKEELIDRVEAVIGREQPELEILCQKGALLADEMLENALYGAPRGENGAKLYHKGEERLIEPRERIVFRFAFDGETLAMEVADGWGSLSPDLVLKHLAHNQEKPEMFDETGGRGLFIIWRFLDHFHVNIVPGRQTVVGGHLRVSSPFDPEAPRGFHISTLHT